MHYKNGREAKNGDKVVVLPAYGEPYGGILHGAVPGNDYCNGQVAIVSKGVNLKECLHADDVVEAFAPISGPAPTSTTT